MTRLVSMPPAAQLAPLLTAYSQAAAAKRRQLVLGLALVAIALAVSAVGAEVRPVTLWNKIGNFTSYFDRLLKLDSGMRVWTDPQEWFWGLARWSRLLGETALIAYIATLTGAFAAFICAAPASRNLMRYAPVRFTVRRVLEFCRSVPDIVFAMIFVAAFGLGALLGVLEWRYIRPARWASCSPKSWRISTCGRWRGSPRPAAVGSRRCASP